MKALFNEVKSLMLQSVLLRDRAKRFLDRIIEEFHPYQIGDFIEVTEILAPHYEPETYLLRVDKRNAFQKFNDKNWYWSASGLLFNMNKTLAGEDDYSVVSDWERRVDI